MGAQLATLQFVGHGGAPLDFHVFPDGIVVVQAGKGHQAGMAFGAVGGLVAAASAKKKVDQLRTEADHADTTSATAFAAGIDGAELVPAANITEARLEKAFGKGRKLVVTTTDRGKQTYRFASNRQSPDEVAAVLQSVLDTCFVNSL